MAGRACLVVGGGPVATRKARGLLACGAVVTVVAPELSQAMADLSPLQVARRAYAPGEAAHYALVITATGHPEVDARVYADAEAAGVWVNSADDHQHCSFILPAVHRAGPVSIAVSSGGTSPALASWLRDQVAERAGPELAALADLLGRARRRVQEAGESTEAVDWAGLLDGPFTELVRAGQLPEAQALLESALGVTL